MPGLIIFPIIVNKLIMLKHIARSCYFLSKHNPNSKNLAFLDSSTEDVLEQRKNLRQQVRKQQLDQVPAQQNYRMMYENLLNITLYLRQDCWKSHFIDLVMNYNKLGFRRVSDLVMLDRASYFLDLRKIQEEERWPTVRITVALQPKIILNGIDPIFDFFRSNKYFINDITEQQTQIKAVEQFIEEKVVPYLDSLFWHPMLTYQYTFHTHQASYFDTTRDNYVYGMIGRNVSVIIPRIVKNLGNIYRENQRYRNSKDKLRQGLQELVKGCLEKHPFLGGQKPGRLDFYLMALLRTKSNSKLFMRYLERDVGRQFWSWWMRVSNLCQYNPDRMTLL